MQKKGYQRIVVDDKDVPFTGTGASRLIFYPDAWTGSWTVDRILPGHVVARLQHVAAFAFTR